MGTAVGGDYARIAVFPCGYSAAHLRVAVVVNAMISRRVAALVRSLLACIFPAAFTRSYPGAAVSQSSHTAHTATQPQNLLCAAARSRSSRPLGQRCSMHNESVSRLR